MTTTEAGMPQGPIRIAGHPSAEEIAAVVAVLSAAGGGDGGTEESRTTLWADHERAVRLTPSHGRGAWRASAQPR